MTTELTDAQLVERCRSGDPEAWNELVERFSRYVYAIAVRANTSWKTSSASCSGSR